MKILVFIDEKEKRIALTEETVKKLSSDGHIVEFEEKLSLSNDIDIVISINPLPTRIIKHMKRGAISIALQKPHVHKENIELFKKMKITSFALDMIPRTTRAQYMDVLSSQSSLAGYRSVIEAAYLLDRSMPMMMTTAGTISAAKFLIIGAGVAGLQAIATAKRLGAIVNAFDVRKAAKEQVESLGAKFVDINSEELIDSVYARETSKEYNDLREEKLKAILPVQDVVITTAQIPFKKAPVILTKDMIALMKTNSIVIDLASETGGNCDLTEHGKTIVHSNGVRIVSFENILWNIALDASFLFSKNVYAFLDLLIKRQNEVGDLLLVEDEIIKGTLLTYAGKVLKEF